MASNFCINRSPKKESSYNLSCFFSRKRRDRKTVTPFCGYPEKGKGPEHILPRTQPCGIALQKRYPLQTRAESFKYKKPAERELLTAGVVPLAGLEPAWFPAAF